MATQKLITGEPDHERIFAVRYSALLKLANAITGQDRSLAHDLVQDAYVQFVSARRDLTTIRNLDSYFFGVLKNLYVSHTRRAARSPLTSLPASDYDSADMGLMGTKPQDLIRFQEELSLVSKYVCAAKKSSRAASIFILRFFHGYFPVEIGRITGNSRAAISESIRALREELHRCLRVKNTGSMARRSEIRVVPAIRLSSGSADVHRQLQRAIFTEREGACCSPSRLREIYAQEQSTPVSKEFLAHIVSCRECLDCINRHLGLPLLINRNAIDRSGRDDDSHDGGAGGGFDDEGDIRFAPARQRLKQLFNHHPRNLSILVNGRHRASHGVCATHNEIVLDLGSDAVIAFVEILSEQGVRLLFLSADEPGDEHCIFQRISLSDERSLEATLTRDPSHQTVRVCYRNPANADSAVRERPLFEAKPSEAITPDRGGRFGKKTRSGRHPLRRRIWGLGIATAVVLIGVVLWVKRTPTVAHTSATALLSLMSQAEQPIGSDIALHRIVEVEERSTSGVVLTRERIEIWRNPGTGVSARRVYDLQNQLVAGEWKGSDGTVRVLDRRGKIAVESGHSGSRQTFTDAWRFDPSAEQFTQWTNSGSAGVSDTAAGKVISYRARPAQAGLLSAELRLKPGSMRATEAVLTIRQGDIIHEFYYTESSYESIPLERVDPSVFLPRRSQPSVPRKIAKPANTDGSASLEIDAVYLLSRVNADVGEQIEVNRAKEIVAIEGVVTTRARKQQILNALRPLQENPWVRINILAFQDKARRPIIGSGMHEYRPADTYEFRSVRPQVDAQIRSLLEQKLSSSALDSEVAQFEAEVVHDSISLLQETRALDSIASRIPMSQLARLDAPSKQEWIALVTRHAEAVHALAVLLDQKIAPAFFSDLAIKNSPPIMPMNAAELAATSQRLSERWSECDRQLSAAFSIATAGHTAETADWATIQSSLADLSDTSTGILQAAQRLTANLSTTSASQ